MATQITEKLTIDGNGSKIVLDGLDFTAGGFVDVYHADEIVIKNCRVYGIVPNAAKSFWMNIHNDIPVKVTVENCFFGSNPTVGANKMYNLFEMTAKLKYGSSISNNYFTADCCTHNIINVYGCEDSAKVYIDGNHFELNNSIRIGVKGEPKCVISMKENTIDANDEGGSPTYDGIACIQPYGKQTKTFANMSIVLSNNTLPEGQIIYAYSGQNDTEMDVNTVPDVVVNGRKFELPIYH